MKARKGRYSRVRGKWTASTLDGIKFNSEEVSDETILDHLLSFSISHYYHDYSAAT